MRLSSLFLAAAIVGLAGGTAMADTMMKASPKPHAMTGHAMTGHSMKSDHMKGSMKSDHMKGGSMKSDHMMGTPKPSPNP